jgi:hypothetical protein
MHPSLRRNPCFDIYGSEDDIPLEIKDYVYRSEYCPYVKRVGLEDYVCSTDLAWLPEMNEKVLKGIVELVRKGYDLVWMDFEEDDP